MFLKNMEYIRLSAMVMSCLFAAARALLMQFWRYFFLSMSLSSGLTMHLRRSNAAARALFGCCAMMGLIMESMNPALMFCGCEGSKMMKSELSAARIQRSACASQTRCEVVVGSWKTGSWNNSKASST